MFGIEWAKLMSRFFCIGAITALLAGGLALGPSRAQEGCLHITSRVARLLPLDMATGIGASTVAPKYGAWGIDLSGRDLSVQPGDNFYRYANGAWDDRTEIPPDRTSFSNFAVLAMLGETRRFGGSAARARRLSRFVERPRAAGSGRHYWGSAGVPRLGASVAAEDTPDAIIEQTKSNPHSPAQFRVIGPPRNNDGVYPNADPAVNYGGIACTKYFTLGNGRALGHQDGKRLVQAGCL
jgi:hypothetical protein